MLRPLPGRCPLTCAILGLWPLPRWCSSLSTLRCLSLSRLFFGDSTVDGAFEALSTNISWYLPLHERLTDLKHVQLYGIGCGQPSFVVHKKINKVVKNLEMSCISASPERA
jgi:hypothetical protein